MKKRKVTNQISARMKDQVTGDIIDQETMTAIKRTKEVETREREAIVIGVMVGDIEKGQKK